MREHYLSSLLRHETLWTIDHSETTVADQVALDGSSGSDPSGVDLTAELAAGSGGWTGTVWSNAPAHHNSNKLPWQVVLTTVHSTVWHSLEANIADSADSWVDAPDAALTGAAVPVAGLAVWTEPTTRIAPASCAGLPSRPAPSDGPIPLVGVFSLPLPAGCCQAARRPELGGLYSLVTTETQVTFPHDACVLGRHQTVGRGLPVHGVVQRRLPPQLADFLAADFPRCGHYGYVTIPTTAQRQHGSPRI